MRDPEDNYNRRYYTREEAERAKKQDHLVCDDGSNVSPRFCVMPVPKIGSPVSKSFNGDSYPAGAQPQAN